MEIDEVNAQGTLKEMSSAMLLLNSIFQLAPTVFFLYAIFQIICYVLIVDLKEIGKTEDGNKIYDRIEPQSITFRD